MNEEVAQARVDRQVLRFEAAGERARAQELARNIEQIRAELHEANSTVAALEESLRSLLRSRWRRLGVALRLSKRHPTPFGEM